MPPPDTSRRLHATTILAVKRDGSVAVAGDGQVTFGDVVIKHGARKIRRLHGGQVLAGFAGAAADALTLIDRFEGHLTAARGNLRKAAVETAKDWRTDRAVRHLEAELIIADSDTLLLLSGDGDVLEPDDGAIAIGAGGTYAYAAAKALLEHTALSAREIVAAAMQITARICIYTNDTLMVEVVGDDENDETKGEGRRASGEESGDAEGTAGAPAPAASSEPS